jgi:flagellar motor switch protein FliM
VGDHLGGEGVIDLGTDFAFHLVDRLFGGPGDPLPLHRALTSIERTVVQGVAERSLTVLRDAWQDQLPMAPEVTGFESSPDMLQITSRVDNVLVANLEVHSGSFRGFLTICLPMGSLEPFLQEKAAARQPAGRGDSDQAAARASLEASLLQAQLTLSARFPQFRLTAREVAGLQVGQVVQTGQPLDTLVEMHVNGRLRYLGALGQRRRRVGLRIVQPAAPAAGRTGCATEGRVS